MPDPGVFAADRHVTRRELDDARVRDISAAGWKEVAWRVKDEIGADRLNLVSGGVAFYGFLAIFPALTAVISIWGLLGDPSRVEAQVATLSSLLPASAHDLLTDSAVRITQISPSSLGLGVVLSLALTLWSANKGMKGLIEGVCIAYTEDHRSRGFVRQNALSLLLTTAAVVMVVLAVGLVVAVPVAFGVIGLRSDSYLLIHIGRWPFLAVTVLAGLAIIYRVSPPNSRRAWRWVIPGAVVATALWIAASLGLSYYAERASSYDRYYGSIAAVAFLLLWFYMSAYIVLLGAEINSETENQVALDAERPTVH